MMQKRDSQEVDSARWTGMEPDQPSRWMAPRIRSFVSIGGCLLVLVSTFVMDQRWLWFLRARCPTTPAPELGKTVLIRIWGYKSIAASIYGTMIEALVHRTLSGMNMAAVVVLMLVLVLPNLANSG